MTPEGTLTRSFAAPGSVSLRVAIPDGVVTVDTGDTDRVDVVVEPLRGNGSDLESVVIDAVEHPDSLVVDLRSRAEGFGFGRRRCAFRVALTCPPGASLEVASAGDVVARGDLGAVRIRTAAGDVILGRASSLSMESASGGLVASEVRADADVKTTSGDVLLRSVGGGLVVSAVSGDVGVDMLGGELRVSTVSGDVRVGAVGGNATVNAVSGDVELRVPRGRRLWLDVRSASGDVRSDLDVEEAASMGDDEVWEITVRTVSGDVRLGRAS